MTKTEKWILLFLVSASVICFLVNSVVIGFAILLMIGLHEMGHLKVAKWCGVETGGFYFLPGLGGVSFIKGFPAKRWHDFLIAYGGPLVGFALTILLVLTNIFVLPLLVPDSPDSYRQYLAPAWFIAYIWALINLLNLLPILPLDGGRIAHAIGSGMSKSYLPYGAIVLGFLALMLFNMTFNSLMWTVLLAIFGYLEIKNLMKYESMNQKIDMSDGQAVASIVLYMILAGLLFALLIISVTNCEICVKIR